MKGTTSRGQRGLSTTYASLLSFLIVFSILILFFSTVFNYNYTLQEQMRIEYERSQEKITISKLELDESKSYLSRLYINNTGTITVKIRAIYLINTTMTTLLADPSTYMETPIEPSESLCIPFNPEIAFQPNAKLSAATERGIKTSEYEGLLIYGSPEPHWKYDPNKFYIGPLMLQFNAFWYRRTNQDGVLDPIDPWHPGWRISKGFGYCAWNITVMNIDDRNITINRYSSFTVAPCDSPSSTLSWYLEPTNQADYTQFLASNQTNNILYIWSAPKVFPDEGAQNSATKMNLPVCRCMVFLTFYGIFNEHDGSTTPYAQTIPFEAAITIE